MSFNRNSRRNTGNIKPSLKWLFEQAQAEADANKQDPNATSPEDKAKAEKIINDKDVESAVADINSATPGTLELLGKGLDDNDPNDDKVATPSPVARKVTEFLPTQSEISLMKSIGFPLGKYDKLKNIITGDPTGRGMSIAVTNNLVIDGHHRWSSAWAIGGPEAPILAQDIGWPGDTAGEVLAKAQITIAAKMKKTPLPSVDAGLGDNILGVGDAIEGMIRERVGKPTEKGWPLLGEEYLAQVIPSPEGKQWFGLTGTETPQQALEIIIKKVSANLASLPAPAAGSPIRKLMPQFDPKVGGPDIADVLPDLAAGKVNVKAPIAENVIYNSDRFKLLAGIKTNKRIL